MSSVSGISDPKHAGRLAAQARVTQALQQGDLEAVHQSRSVQPRLISTGLLRQAAQTGRHDLVHALIEVAKSSVQRSALYAAIKGGSLNEVTLLVEHACVKAQIAAMKSLRTAPGPWVIALAPLVHPRAQHAGLLSAAKFRLWDACQVFLGLFDLASAPESVRGDFLSDCVAGAAPAAVMAQGMNFSSSADRVNAMRLAAALGRVGAMREILKRSALDTNGNWLAQAGASACEAGKEEALAFLLGHTTVESIWDCLDWRAKVKPDIVDRLGQWAPAELQTQWLERFPGLLPMTAAVHLAETRKRKACELRNDVTRPNPGRRRP